MLDIVGNHYRLAPRQLQFGNSNTGKPLKSQDAERPSHSSKALQVISSLPNQRAISPFFRERRQGPSLATKIAYRLGAEVVSVLAPVFSPVARQSIKDHWQGLMHWRKGEYSEAEASYRRVLAYEEGRNCRDPLNMRIILEDLALLCKAQGKHDETNAFFARARNISFWGE
jgi:hypothetical protein